MSQPIDTIVTDEAGFSVLDPVDVAPPGSNFEAYIETGLVNLIVGQQVYTVTFATEKASSSYVFDEELIYNNVDTSPIVFSVNYTTLSTTQFQFVLSGVPDTGNYYFRWKVRIPTTIVEGNVTPTAAVGGVTEVTVSTSGGISGTVSNPTTQPTINLTIPDSGLQLTKLAQSVVVDDGTVTHATNNQTITSKDISGATNTLHDIPVNAIAGSSQSTLVLTDPNADRLPYWKNSGKTFDWKDPADFFTVDTGLSALPGGSYAFRDINQMAVDSIDSRLVGQTPGATSQNLFSSIDNTNSVYVRNNSNFLHDIDLTCVPVYQSAGPAGVTAISPNYVLFANHAGLPNGTTVRFVDLSNNVVSRTTSGASNIGGTDISIAVLSSPLPDSISFAKILRHPKELSTAPIVSVDQNQVLHVADTDIDDITVGYGSPAQSNRLPFYSVPISGDSGHPLLAILDGTPILLAAFLTTGSGPNISNYINSINSAMSGDQLTEFDTTSLFNRSSSFYGTNKFSDLRFASTTTGMVVSNSGALSPVSVTALQSVRLNSAGTAFEAYTPTAPDFSGAALLAGNNTFTGQNTFGLNSILNVQGVTAQIFITGSLITDQNDFTFSGNIGVTSAVRFNPTADPRTITGIVPTVTATGGNISGRQLTIINSSSTNRIILTHEDTNSAAANRFNFPNGKRSVIPPLGAISLRYDTISSRWKTTSAIRLSLITYTVATLPSSPIAGDEAAVSDATTPTYLGTLTGGGGVYAPVVYNGSAWVSH